MNHTSVLNVLKENVAVVLVRKHTFSVYFNLMEKYIQKLFQTVLIPRYMPIMRGKVSLESIIYSDSWRGYNGLVDLGYKKYY